MRAAVGETRLHPPGSLPWRMALLTACAAARDHINDLERGALARFRREARAPACELLGHHWLAYVAARPAGPDPAIAPPEAT